MTRYDLFGVLTIAVFMLLVLGLAGLLLWLRDRSRDWRAVPDWVRKRSELRARKLAAAYMTLWLSAFCISCFTGAVRFFNRPFGIFFLIPGGMALWAIRGSWSAYRQLTLEIQSVEREHQGQAVKAEKKIR